MKRSIREFLEGFGGRAVLLVAAALITVTTGVGGWFAKRVGDNQDKCSEKISAFAARLAETNGEKISRLEFETKLDRLSMETKDHRIETRESFKDVKERLDHLGDVMMSLLKPQPGE